MELAQGGRRCVTVTILTWQYCTWAIYRLTNKYNVLNTFVSILLFRKPRTFLIRVAFYSFAKLTLWRCVTAFDHPCVDLPCVTATQLAG